MLKKYTEGIYEIKWVLLFHFSPFILLTLLGKLYIPSYWSFFKELIAFGALSYIFFVFCTFPKNHRLKKILLNFSFAILYLFLSIKLIFYNLYKVKISGSALFVIFETNNKEITGYFSDFIKNLSAFWIFTIVFIFILLARIKFSSLLLKELKKLPVLIFSNKFLKIIALSGAAGLTFLILKRLRQENISLVSYDAIIDYKEFKRNMKNVLAQETNANIKINSTSISPDQEQTHVIIIGESTSKWHMQLYDYNRETNPLLSQNKNLNIYQDVISPHTHTILSIEKIFTMLNFEKPYSKSNFSIIQLANMAGYETYWLSNQKPFGIDESVPAIIGSAAKNKYFINSEDYGYDVYDEKLLPTFNNILNENKPNKIIFIHLMGTHSPYKRRYPETYDYFHDKPNSDVAKTKYTQNTINQYDNSVRYNDFIVSEIIKSTSMQDKISYVSYFSDHGDEVYDTMNFMGHNEYLSTPPMYEIPFLMWFSEKFKQKHPELNNLNHTLTRKYNLEDFIHSFADITRINFEQYSPSKSIFNPSFIEKKRLIKKGVDYDNK